MPERFSRLLYYSIIFTTDPSRLKSVVIKCSPVDVRAERGSRDIFSLSSRANPKLAGISTIERVTFADEVDGAGADRCGG